MSGSKDKYKYLSYEEGLNIILSISVRKERSQAKNTTGFIKGLDGKI